VSIQSDNFTSITLNTVFQTHCSSETVERIKYGRVQKVPWHITKFEEDVENLGTWAATSEKIHDHVRSPML
jgi:hypothetical protein